MKSQQWVAAATSALLLASMSASPAYSQAGPFQGKEQYQACPSDQHRRLPRRRLPELLQRRDGSEWRRSLLPKFGGAGRKRRQLLRDQHLKTV